MPLAPAFVLGSVRSREPSHRLRGHRPCHPKTQAKGHLSAVSAVPGGHPRGLLSGAAAGGVAISLGRGWAERLSSRAREPGF